MKIAVIGTGAMGSIYAGLLGDAGNEVWAIDLWQDHLDTIRDKGLRVEGASGDRIVTSLNVANDVAEAGACDLYIVATKASGVETAAESIKPLLSEGAAVLAMQNGLGAGERIAKVLPSEAVLLGVAEGFGGSMKGPGHAHHNGMQLIRIGALNGGRDERAIRITKIWEDAGFPARAYDDINQLIWEKFICNVAYSAPCTVFNRTISGIMNDPHSRSVSQGCAREAYEAGRAKGVAISFDDPVAYVTAFGERMPDARPSMLLDHMAKRPSEIDAINGMVPVVAAEVGTKAPYNEVMSAIVRSREAEFAGAP